MLDSGVPSGGRIPLQQLGIPPLMRLPINMPVDDATTITCHRSVRRSITNSLFGIHDTLWFFAHTCYPIDLYRFMKYVNEMYERYQPFLIN